MSAVGVILIALLLLLAVPYYGIRHDSQLYLAQALREFVAPQLGEDLFFASGSQANFTIFPTAVGWILKYISASTLFEVATFLGRLAFLASSWFLLNRLVPKKIAHLSILAVLALPAVYGGRNIMQYGEPFFTGRTLAEPLLLLSVASLIAGWQKTCFSLWMLAAAFHPLQALPIALLIGLWYGLRYPRILIAVILVASLFILGAFSQNKLLVYDARWWNGVGQVNPMVRLDQWSAEDGFSVVKDMFLIGIVWWKADGALKRFAKVIFIGAALSFGATAFLSDALQIVLATSLQFWRFHWILHWCAMGLLPWILMQHLEVGEVARTIFIFLIVLLGMPIFGATPAFYGVSSALMIFYIFWSRIIFNSGPAMARLIVCAVFAASLAFYFYFAIETIRWRCVAEDCVLVDRSLILHPLNIFGVCAAFFVAWRHAHRLAQWFAIGVLTALCAVLALTWDQRDDRVVAIEKSQPRSINSASVFGVGLEKNAQIFWPDNLLATWLVLQRPQYLSDGQLSGVLFNKGTFEEAFRRSDFMLSRDRSGQICGLAITRSVKALGLCEFDDGVVQTICEDAKDGLLYLVLAGGPTRRAVGTWVLPGGTNYSTEKKWPPVTYSLYRCADFANYAQRGVSQSIINANV